MENQEKIEAHRRTRPTEVTIVSLPDRQATITAKSYTNALGLLHEGNAYLEPLNAEFAEKVEYRDGRLHFAGTLESIPETEIQNMASKEYIDAINLPLLRTIYSIILKEYEKTDYQNLSSIVLYVPDLFEILGMKRNQSREQIKELIMQINQYKNIVGVVAKSVGTKVSKSYYALLNFNYYDDEKNTLSISSPYIEYIAKRIYEDSIRRDKNGMPNLLKNGKPSIAPTHSYLIKSEIAKERNKTAIENVGIIVTLIEQSGNHIPHISAKTIVDRNPLLQQRLNESIAKNRQRILDRVFAKTWELLHTMTYLEEIYPGIKLPDMNDLPQIKKLDKEVFDFPHHGKTRKNTVKEE